MMSASDLQLRSGPPRHGDLGWDVPIAAGTKATFSIFYSGQSGRPYTLIVYGDINGDTYTNDLAYIRRRQPRCSSPTGPTSSSSTGWARIRASSTTWARSSRAMPAAAPGINTLDARVNVQLPFKAVKAELTLDVLNLLNLLNSASGIVKFVSYGENTNLTKTVINRAPDCR